MNLERRRKRPLGKPPSEAQRKARWRNWAIFRLRGPYWNVGLLTGERQLAARAAIDAELEHLGAESMTGRLKREREEAERYEKFRAALIGNYTVF